MNADERSLISSLFDRMRAFGAPEKDRDADALIAQSMRANPDAGYMLVQSVLVQEQALQQADERIQELEARVRDLEANGSRQAAAAGSGGFLGGMFGRGASARPAGSVPNIGRAAPAPVAQPPANSPWGRSSAAAQQQQPVQGAGGGFLKSAMATAAGVAGGMLLADSIRNMMGGHNQSGTQSASTDTMTGEPTASDNTAAYEPQYQDPNDNDPGTYDAAFDSSGGMDDLDI
jgi:hypothetical protein